MEGPGAEGSLWKGQERSLAQPGGASYWGEGKVQPCWSRIAKRCQTWFCLCFVFFGQLAGFCIQAGELLPEHHQTVYIKSHGIWGGCMTGNWYFLFFPLNPRKRFLISKQGSLSSLLLLQINTGVYFYNLSPLENGDWAFIPALHKDVCFNDFYLDDSPSALGLLKLTFLELLPSAESTEVVSTSHVARCWHF